MSQTRITIAYAEDLNLIREALITTINQFPNCIVVADAGNGQEMIHKIAALETPPDICLVDISMPVMNGYDTVSALRKLYKNMKFIALTDVKLEYSISQMIQKGINGYLNKNCYPDELSKSISDVFVNSYCYNEYASQETFEFIKKNKLQEPTPKELELLCLICNMGSYKKIADRLCISERTVQEHCSNICQKLGLHTRHDLVLFAFGSGLVSPY